MKKILLCLCVLFSIVLNCAYAAPVTKLYRNRDYQFSLNIPSDMTYRQPRGPNVKMSATTPSADLLMNIIVKPTGGFKFFDDEILRELHNIHVANASTNMIYLDHKIINIPGHRVLLEKARCHYVYPNNDFWLDTYMFTLASNFKFYQISYLAPIDKIPYQVNTIMQSVESFVDETGWY